MAEKISTRSKKNKSVIDEESNKILSAELTESFVTLRTLVTLVTQSLAALLAANVAYLGYALTTKKSLVLMGGALFPLLILAVLSRGRKWMIPVIYSILHIEKVTIGYEIGAGTNFISFIQGQKYVDKLLSINTKTSLEEKRMLLRKMPLPMGDKGITRLVCVLSAIGQIILGIILWKYFQWSFL